VLSPRGSELVLTDTRLLFYYQNRLAAHGLAYDAIAPKGAAVPAAPIAKVRTEAAPSA
jgi:glycerol-3-phosphate O-acyltransferase